MLPKGLKFVRTNNKIDRARLKIEFEEHRRWLRLMHIDMNRDLL